MQKSFRISYYLIRVMMLDRSENSLRLFFEILSMSFRYFLLIAIYYYLFEFKGEIINGQTLQIVSWSIFFYFAFLMINFRYLSRTIMQEVKSGKIEILLSKPMNYLNYKFFESFGSKLIPFLINFILLSTVLFFIFGIPESMQSVFFVSTFLITFAFCLLLNFLIYAIVGMLAFWIEDTSSILWIVDKFIMVLGGSFLPVAFFPPLMQSIANYSPFGASMFITQTVYNYWALDYLKLISMQIFWVVILSVILFVIFKRAMKSVSVNGG